MDRGGVLVSALVLAAALLVATPPPQDPMTCIKLVMIVDALESSRNPTQQAAQLMQDPEFRHYVGPAMRFLKFGGTREMVEKECAI